MTEHRLLQEVHADTENHLTNSWRVLVVCILLNQTTGNAAGPVMADLFKRWPSPVKMACADHDQLFEHIRHLGFGGKRTEYLIEMSKQYAQWMRGRGQNPDWKTLDVPELRGCGQYAHEAWRMFVLGERDFQPKDWELRKRMRELNGEVVDWEAEDIRHKEEKKKAKEEEDTKKERVLSVCRRRDCMLKEKKEQATADSRIKVAAVRHVSKSRDAADKTSHKTKKNTRHIKAQERKV